MKRIKAKTSRSAPIQDLERHDDEISGMSSIVGNKNIKLVISNLLFCGLVFIVKH